MNEETLSLEASGNSNAKLLDRAVPPATRRSSTMLLQSR